MKTILYIFGIMCLLGLYACSHDQFEIGTSTSSSSSVLSVTYSMNKLTNESSTRASVAPEEGEETVNSLFLFFFEASSDRSGAFVDYIEVEGTLSMNSRIVLNTSGTSISSSGSYHVIGVANVHDNQYIEHFQDWVSQWMDNSEQYFRNNAIADLSGFSNNGFDAESLLMSGSTTKAAMDGNISLALTRNVARFDVLNEKNTEFDLMSTSVWNAHRQASITGDAVVDYSQTAGLRTEKFSTFDNSENITDGKMNNIRGGLYAFPNQVTSPGVSDVHTTCLVVGLKNRSTGKTGYYRVNIHPSDEAQNLKRNNVYRLTITGVTGEGAATEEEAYAGSKNELQYIINYWTLDDNGLIVSDSYSILAVPVKTVKIGTDGGDFSYSITTFSTLDSPAPLAIKSQTYNPQSGKISAQLIGGSLVITAEPMDFTDEERSGIIILSYAGLEASVNVVQSPSVDTYLTVTLEDTWSSMLPAVAGISSQYIYVAASGKWTATLYGSEGFSLKSPFDPTAGSAAVETVTSDEVGNKFQVYTHTKNEDETGVRKTFVLISLDDDPVNYVAVVPIQQAVVGNLDISPVINETTGIVFNGAKAITSHTTNVFTFTSNSSTFGSTPVTLPNDTNFDYSMTGEGTNVLKVTVTANANNTSGNLYAGTMTVATIDGSTVSVSLKQNSLNISVSPSSFNSLSNDGASTALITVSTGDPLSMWTAEISTKSTTAGKSLINHKARLIGEDGEVLEFPVSVSKKFRVEYPKVYFPNRETGISAEVKIKIVGSTLAQTITVNQTALTSKGLKLFNAKYLATSNPYGNFHSTYIRAYKDAFIALGYNDFWTNGDNNNNRTAAIPAGTTYTHFANRNINSGYDWSVLQNFRKNTDGILVMCVQANEVDALNSATSPLFGYNITYGGADGSKANTLVSDVENTRIGKFLTTHGVRPIANPDLVEGFYSDGVHTSAKNLPTTATRIMQKPGGNTLMAIDIENRMVYLGESQVFYRTSNVPVGSLKENFMYNFVEYVINASKYGSHFTDLLREDLGLPVLWSDDWGANKWPK